MTYMYMCVRDRVVMDHIWRLMFSHSPICLGVGVAIMVCVFVCVHLYICVYVCVCVCVLDAFLECLKPHICTHWGFINVL